MRKSPFRRKAAFASLTWHTRSNAPFQNTCAVARDLGVFAPAMIMGGNAKVNSQKMARRPAAPGTACKSSVRYARSVLQEGRRVASFSGSFLIQPLVAACLRARATISWGAK